MIMTFFFYRMLNIVQLLYENLGILIRIYPNFIQN
jgi:hypothetical protein